MLTRNQQKFILNIINGLSELDAYRAVYACARLSGEAIAERAAELLKNDNIASWLTAVRARLYERDAAGSDRRLRCLASFIDDDENSVSDRIRAIDLMNKMTGEYAPRSDDGKSCDININIELGDE